MCIEFNWYWLVDGLTEADFAVHVANTAAIKQYECLKYAGDERDAVLLAHIFRLGLLPEGCIFSPPQRALRDFGRKRLQLVQHRPHASSSIETLLAREPNLRLNGDHVQRLNDEAVRAFILPAHVERSLMANLAVMRTLRAEIAALEAILLREATLKSEFEIMRTLNQSGCAAKDLQNR